MGKFTDMAVKFENGEEQTGKKFVLAKDKGYIQTVERIDNLEIAVQKLEELTAKVEELVAKIGTIETKPEEVKEDKKTTKDKKAE